METPDWLPDEPKADASDVHARVAELATLTPLDYETRRETEAKALGIRVSVLDQQVAAARPKDNGDDETEDDAIVADADPWPDPVDGASLADEVSTDLAHFVVFRTPEQADAVTLWIFGTYLMDEWALWPKMLISSPEKRCGKTVLVETIEAHAARAFLVSNISAAGLFRVIEDFAPTVLIDEADRFLRRNEETNGIINAGHRRRTAVVVRVEERNGEPRVRKFSVWGAQVIAGIGSQEDTLVDRSIRVALRRRLQSEKVTKLPARYYEDRLRVRRQLARWAGDHRIRIAAMSSEAPACGNDRAQDNWTPLFRIAEALGGDWPARCAAAYKAIEVSNDDTGETLGARLLRDMAGIMATFTDRMGSNALREKLILLEDAPWGDFPGTNRPITAQRMAAILRDYEVRPRQDRLGSYYDPEDIAKALERYGSQAAPENSATSATSATGGTATTEKGNEINARWQCGSVADDGGRPGKHSPGGRPETASAADDPDVYDPEMW